MRIKMPLINIHMAAYSFKKFDDTLKDALKAKDLIFNRKISFLKREKVSFGTTWSLSCEAKLCKPALQAFQLTWFRRFMQIRDLIALADFNLK